MPNWLTLSITTLGISFAAAQLTTVSVAAAIGGFAVGLVLFASSLRRFAVQGKGTLAPWDPPSQLVIVGPYRFVRNPMISGVLFTLFGEALILLSWPHFQWAVMFLVINAIYIPLFEEPQLEALFG